MSATGTYLDGIVRDVRRRLDAVAPQAVRVRASHDGPSRSLRATIEERRAQGELAIIAEVKRRSPSVGEIHMDVDPAAQASVYDAAGAAGISVLTEPDHFGGSLDDLVAARAAVGVPVLRKDFIIDVRQLHEAQRAGADAVLLIAALHVPQALAELVSGAGSLGLEVLLEVHDEEDLERALTTDAVLIGINNRDLRSFVVDLAVTERLAPLVPGDRLVIAESGVRTEDDAERMRAAGVAGLLVGEALMRAAEPATLLRRLATAGREPTSMTGP